MALQIIQTGSSTQHEGSNIKSLVDYFGDSIHTYTRLQAIEDGVLVDATEMASEAGFRVPVAVSAAVWGDCVEWYDEDSQRQTHQTVNGRLWDLCWMASCAARRGGQVVNFQLYRIPRGGRGIRPRLVSLRAVCGPDDDGNPCVTIMGIDED